MTEYVTIGGKQRAFRFSYKAMKKFRNLTAEAEKKGTTVDDDQVIYLGLLHGALKEGEKVDFKVEDIEDWIDEEPDKLGEIMEVYTRQLGKLMGGVAKARKNQTVSEN